MVGPLPKGLDQGAGTPVQTRVPEIKIGKLIGETNQADGAHAPASPPRVHRRVRQSERNG
ncbi:MAG: hypothetical protein ACREI9_11950 [Nitrospiraceae bacterium]